MNCEDARALVHGYIDGELDLATSLDVERHVGGCPGCATELAALQALGAIVRNDAPYYAAPRRLGRRVRSGLREADRPGRWRTRALVAVAASVALVAALGLALLRQRPARTDVPTRTHELVASHIRSQMLDSHRFDVASSDAHTVKPWFQGKVDFAPPAKDLAEQGFPLVGGRLDYLGERPVAALVYQRRKHVINVFVWPSTPSDDASPEQTAWQGFNLVRGTTADLTFWAVSDLNATELRQFARLLQE